MSLEKNVSMFVDACDIEVRSSEAANVTSIVVEKVEFEDALAGEVVGAQDGDCSLPEEAKLVVEC